MLSPLRSKLLASLLLAASLSDPLAGSLLAQERSVAQPAVGPFSRAERSGYTETSTLADLQQFLDELGSLEGASSFQVSEFGRSGEDRPMLVVRVPSLGAPSVGESEPLRVVILANIHGGEVCGKEAVQILLREWARGDHLEIRRACELWVVPIYNVDGNEAVATTNRQNVNGPVGGLGERPNSQGFDLNRDFVKAKAPETRALLRLLDEVQPHAFFDLHTTNGSDHAFHLTYAAGLSPNTDPQLTEFSTDRLLEKTRTAVRDRHGYEIFDYGNFGRGEPVSYETFDHRPRFATNYVALRNCIAILSEAYAYEPFEVRVRATRAFVLESLRVLGIEKRAALAVCALARVACENGEPQFRWETGLVEGTSTPIPTRGWDRMPLEGGGTRVMRRSEIEFREARVRVRFHADRAAPLPGIGWALPPETDDEVLDTLRAHGLDPAHVTEARSVRAARFVPSSGDRAQRPFQGVRNVTLRGEWQDPTETRLTEGWWLVSSRTPLSRVAAQLLEPLSEDGLTTWGFLVEQTVIAGEGRPGRYPVLRVE